MKHIHTTWPQRGTKSTKVNPLFYFFFCVSCAFLWLFPSVAAQSPSVQSQIYSNLGNVNSSGLPQIKISLGESTELARFGFVFEMTHNVIPGYNGSARTEWKIAGLRTCVYLDGNENLVWIRPNLLPLVFRKAANYKRGDLGWTAVILNDGRDVELTNRDGQKWIYIEGYLKGISDGAGMVIFVTDKETILLALRRGSAGAGNNGVLMRAEYSSEGLLSRLELGQARPVIFQWSDMAALTGIKGLPAGGMTFDYDKMLLREWNNNGVRTNYTWVARDDLVGSKNISFGNAAVRLQSDGEFRYEYANADDVSILRVFRHDGSFVSETRFGDRGIIQKVGDKTIRATYQNDGTGRKLVIDSK